MKQCLTYRRLTSWDMDQVSELAWQTFQKFASVGCTMRGIEEFKRFVHPDDLRDYIRQRILFVWGCFDQERLVGVLASRGYDHIALLFVHEHYQNIGIAKQLFQLLKQAYSAHTESAKEITVHASLYAVDIYKHLGFSQTGPSTLENGLKYVPMLYRSK